MNAATRLFVRTMASKASFSNATWSIPVTGRSALPVQARLVNKPTATPRPALIVLQEWWGVTPQIMAFAQKFGTGLEIDCVVPDLYRGDLAASAQEAEHLMHGLDWTGAMRDIGALTTHLLHKTNHSKVFVCGFCMGGALVVASLSTVPALTAGITFYGIPGEPMRNVTKPLQGHFGKLDSLAGFSDVATAKPFFDSLTKRGVPNELFIYENVGHAFMSTDQHWRSLADIKEPFDAKAAELAFSRAMQFIKKLS